LLLCPTFTASSRHSDHEGCPPRQAVRRRDTGETVWEENVGVPVGKEWSKPAESIIWVSRRGKVKRLDFSM